MKHIVACSVWSDQSGFRLVMDIDWLYAQSIIDRSKRIGHLYSRFNQVGTSVLCVSRVAKHGVGFDSVNQCDCVCVMLSMQ